FLVSDCQCNKDASGVAARRAVSILELAVKHHVFYLVAHVQRDHPGTTVGRGVKKHIAAFGRDERLAVNYARKDVARPEAVVARRLILLDKDTLAAGQEVSVVLQLVDCGLI